MALQFRSMKALKEKTPGVIRAARNGDVVITRRGQPFAVLHLLADVEREGSLLLTSRSLQQRVAKAVREVRPARGTPQGQMAARAEGAGLDPISGTSP